MTFTSAQGGFYYSKFTIDKSREQSCKEAKKQKAIVNRQGAINKKNDPGKKQIIKEKRALVND
jgi:hypothetical protein